MCLPEGQLVPTKFLESDHLEAKSSLIREVSRLIDKLNEDEGVAIEVMKMPGFDDLIIKAKFEADTTEKYYGTKLLYELAFNNIDNLWLICSKCNNTKSDKNLISWLKEQPMLGDKLIQYLQNEKIIEKKEETIVDSKKDSLLPKVKEWYKKENEQYIENLKNIYEKVTVPFEQTAKALQEESDPKEKQNKQNIFDVQTKIAEAATKQSFFDTLSKQGQKDPEALKQLSEILEGSQGPQKLAKLVSTGMNVVHSSPSQSSSTSPSLDT